MGLSFGNKKQPKPKAPEKEETAYVGRAKAEQTRFKKAVDSEFWLCFCFNAKDDKASFFEMFGEMPDFITGDDFRKMTAPAKPEKTRRGFPLAQRGAKFPDPLADVKQTESLENDCFEEAYALLDALKSVKAPDPCKCASDSDQWVVVAFDSREDATQYLDEMGIEKFGNKYVDASAWLKTM